VTAADAAGIEPGGATNGAIGMGAAAFRTKVVLTVAMARGGTIRRHIGAFHLDHGVGNPSQATRAPNFSLAEDPERLTDAALTLSEVKSPAIAVNFNQISGTDALLTPDRTGGCLNMGNRSTSHTPGKDNLMSASRPLT
jgi:hypothetical protein